ncbi:methyltransferase domain-containing protein [Candidatus Micrarchaeota archaeon]|nr:methyltransferase domain-containing protein [Candidatus Micrarchaeota archaeon]
MGQTLPKEEVVKAHFDQRAKVFETGHYVRDKDKLDKIVEFAGLGGIRTALEIGIGTGAVAREIKTKVKELHGLDISVGMLEKASEVLPRNRLVVGDAQNLPFLDNSFEFVYWRSLITHVPQYRKCIEEAYRVSKTKALLIEPTLPDEESANWFFDLNRLRDDTHTCFFTVEEFVEWVEETGLKNVEVETMQQTVEVTNWLEAGNAPAGLKEKVLEFCRNAPVDVKKAVSMRFAEDDASFELKWAMVRGEKY